MCIYIQRSITRIVGFLSTTIMRFISIFGGIGTHTYTACTHLIWLCTCHHEVCTHHYQVYINNYEMYIHHNMVYTYHYWYLTHRVWLVAYIHYTCSLFITTTRARPMVNHRSIPLLKIVSQQRADNP